jgi:hypothetical protein
MFGDRPPSGHQARRTTPTQDDLACRVLLHDFATLRRPRSSEYRWSRPASLRNRQVIGSSPIVGSSLSRACTTLESQPTEVATNGRVSADQFRGCRGPRVRNGPPSTLRLTAAATRLAELDRTSPAANTRGGPFPPRSIHRRAAARSRSLMKTGRVTAQPARPADKGGAWAGSAIEPGGY